MDYKAYLTTPNGLERIIAQKRKRQYSLRLVCDLLFYLLKTGCQWRELPQRGVSWQEVYYYFRKWQSLGVVEALFYAQNRLRRKRNNFPS